LFAAVYFAVMQFLYAQDAVGYQTPPKEIADLLLAKPTPSVRVDSKAEWMLLSERNSYPTVEELGQPENRIAGMRLNPNNFSPSRQAFINNFRLKNIKTDQEFAVAGLPAICSPVMAHGTLLKQNRFYKCNRQQDRFVCDRYRYKKSNKDQQATREYCFRNSFYMGSMTTPFFTRQLHNRLQRA
jgi:hypothetical protein